MGRSAYEAPNERLVAVAQLRLSGWMDGWMTIDRNQ